jgi:integrase
LTVGRILVEEKAVVFRSLKKRKKDSRGREKQPQFRTVPVPEILIEQLDNVYEIRRLQKKSAGSDVPLWTMSRPTAYRLVKRVMNRAGIVGKQATGKGLRHGFGGAMVTAKKPLPAPRIISAYGPHRHQNHRNIPPSNRRRKTANGCRCVGKMNQYNVFSLYI